MGWFVIVNAAIFLMKNDEKQHVRWVAKLCKKKCVGKVQLKKIYGKHDFHDYSDYSKCAKLLS